MNQQHMSSGPFHTRNTSQWMYHTDPPNDPEVDNMHRHTSRPVLHVCSRVCCTCRHNERKEDPQSRHTDTHAHQDNTAPSAQPLSVTHGTSPTPQTQTQPLTQRPGGPPTHPRNPKCSEIRPPFGSECHTPLKEQSKAFHLLR